MFYVLSEYPWKYALIATLLSMIRNSGILAVCIFNFGPIRNTVGIYGGNLPDHMKELCGKPIFDYFSGIIHRSRDDQRNIVEAAHEDLERASSPTIITKNSKLNIIGKRDSAMSPSNSNNSSLDELPKVQC